MITINRNTRPKYIHFSQNISIVCKNDYNYYDMRETKILVENIKRGKERMPRYFKVVQVALIEGEDVSLIEE